MLHATLLSLLLLGPALAAAQSPAPQSTPPAATPASAPKAQRIASDDAQALLDAGKVFFLDVREPKELEELGTLDGYVNIPLGQVETRLAEIPRDKAIITA
jgi:hypothetical protein